MAVVILLVGCSQATPSVEKQQKREAPQRIEKAPPRDPSPDLPAYDITLQQDCAESGVVGKCYSVSTDATSREELELVTADLWLDSPGYLAVLVTFYPDKPTAEVSATGFAFENEQAARVVLAQFLAQGTSVEDEVREAMANGGIYVVAPADDTRELTQQTALGRAGEASAGRIAIAFLRGGCRTRPPTQGLSQHLCDARWRCVPTSRRKPPIHCSGGVGILRGKLFVLKTLLLGLQTFESLRDKRWRWLPFQVSVLDESPSYLLGWYLFEPRILI
jgi:hypothetical protein